MAAEEGSWSQAPLVAGQPSLVVRRLLRHCQWEQPPGWGYLQRDSVPAEQLRKLDVALSALLTLEDPPSRHVSPPLAAGWCHSWLMAATKVVVGWREALHPAVLSLETLCPIATGAA